MQHLAHTVDPGRRGRNGIGARAGHQHIHVAAKLGSRGHGLVGRVRQGRIVVFSNNKNSHQIAPLALSFATRVGTSSTFSPASRTGGSVTFTTVRRGEMSTP